MLTYFEIVPPETPPPGWVRGYQMNTFSRQFMRFPKLSKFWSLILTPGGVGVKHFLLIFWAVHDIPRTFETGVGWVKFFFSWEWVSYLCECVPNLVGVRRSCRKKSGGGVQTRTKRRFARAPLPVRHSFLPSCLPPVHPPSFHPRITRLRSLPGFAQNIFLIVQDNYIPDIPFKTWNYHV